MDSVSYGVIHSCGRCVLGTAPGSEAGSSVETVGASVPWEYAAQRSWEKGGRRGRRAGSPGKL